MLYRPLGPYKSDFEGLLKELEGVSDLPLAISNGDINYTNLMIDPLSGKVTGLVDWEEIVEMPVGFEFGVCIG
jgi:hypothetical protein